MSATAKQSSHHPAWLQHEINKAAQRKHEAEHYSQQQEQKHHRVTQQARKTRDRIRTTQPQHNTTHNDSTQHTVTFIDNQRPATSTPHGRPQSAAREREREKSKPKWAMTAAEEEKEMEEECEELVGFVEELDFDVWMEEMEERGAKRVEEEKEGGDEGEEEAQERTDALGTLRSDQRVEAVSEWDNNVPRPPTGIRPSTQQRLHTASSRSHTARPSTSPQQTTTDTTETLVATLLHSSSAIRNIHSSHSLRALISSSHGNRGQQVCGSTSVPANSVSVAIPAPLVSVVATRDTIHGKINPSQLPYLHRHPAV